MDTTTPATDTKATTDEPKQTTLPAPARVVSSTPVRTGTGIAGLMPTNVEEFWRLAQYAAASDIVPKDFRGKPHNTLIAMELALELGVPWMQGLQGMSVINGRPAPYGDLSLAIVMTNPLYVKHSEYYTVKGERRELLVADDWKHGDTAAVCTCWRRGQDEPTTRIFTVDMAKKANLLTKPGPWQEYPDRQLRMRARSFALRDTFPDVLKGLAHSVEELRDLPPEAAALEQGTTGSVREIRRMSDTRHDFGIDRERDTRQDDVHDGGEPPPAA